MCCCAPVGYRVNFIHIHSDIVNGKRVCPLCPVTIFYSISLESRSLYKQGVGGGEEVDGLPVFLLVEDSAVWNRER